MAGFFKVAIVEIFKNYCFYFYLIFHKNAFYYILAVIKI